MYLNYVVLVTWISDKMGIQTEAILKIKSIYNNINLIHQNNLKNNKDVIHV